MKQSLIIYSVKITPGNINFPATLLGTPIRLLVHKITQPLMNEQCSAYNPANAEWAQHDHGAFDGGMLVGAGQAGLSISEADDSLREFHT